MEIENAANVIKKDAAEGRLRQTFNNQDTILSDFDRRFTESRFPPGELDIIRYRHELVQVKNTTLGDHIRCPIISGNVFIPGAPRRVSSEETVSARTSRAINMTKHIMTGDGYAISLEGTSTNHPGMNAAENVAALTSCILGAISNVDRKFQGSVKSCVATVELSRGECKNRANAHGSLVIHGRVHLLRIADDFQ
jgi:hypothetical protein